MDWKRLFKLNQDEVLGLDIGSSTVKAVQLRKDDNGYSVIAVGIVDIADGTENDKDSQEINTVKAIHDCLQSTEIKSRLAVCSVCGPEVAVRYFKFPLLPAEEIQGAVLLEAEQVCPFNIDDAAVDYQLIRNGKNSVSGVLVAATHKLVKSKSRLAKEASLSCVLMDIDGLALLNCFSESLQQKPQSGKTIAILNVGSLFANLVIIGDNALPLIRDVGYTGNDTIAKTAKNSRQKKQNAGGLEKTCRKLIADITDTLRYYATQEESAIVEKIFVCGSFALVKGFVGLLDNQLPAKVVLWNPFEKIAFDAALSTAERDTLEKKGPALAVAAGLAMRSI